MIGPLALALAVTLAAQQTASPPSADTSDVAPASDPQLALALRGGERGDASEMWSVRRVYVYVYDDSDLRPERRGELASAMSKLFVEKFGVAIADNVADADAVVSVTVDRAGGKGEVERYTVAGLVLRTQGIVGKIRVIFTGGGEAPTVASGIAAFVSSLETAANVTEP